MQERAALVPAEVLYHSRRDDVNHRVYMHRYEESILVTEGNQLDCAFIEEESYLQLQRSGMRYIHLGVMQVRLQTLYRNEEGTMALVVFRDNHWMGDQAILATMEIDLTHGVFIACNDEYPKETYQEEAFEEYEETQPYILVHKISSAAKIPKQKYNGDAGFDLAASEPCVIAARGKGKIPIGLQIEIPWGSYGRIVTRSSAAWNLGIDIGAGVIDSDYRDIYEAPSLTQISRGDGGFGSTFKALHQPPPLFSKLLPKEKHMLFILFEDRDLPQEGLEENHAGDTSPGATVLWFMDLSLDISEPKDDLLTKSTIWQLSQHL
ncbi:hypothetical protein ZIOFF_047279 [Zingiber officinale]|uniref:Deoxyuridine 5'-triphosphate nucleotidohydrolase n=1 Tax=Zingiber officinale TaxID=94328 RepID=A0A8J5FR96_ZINOF|nr:hypothetical protein ZIOFF_047279 [Zingiber officinale]